MQKIILFLIPLYFLFSCNPSPVKQSFSSADSLVIHFKNELEGVVTKTIQTKETIAIHRIVDFMDAKIVENYKCGYDGKMFFYSKGQPVQEADFKMSDEACNHFSFLLDGKLVNTKMKTEAADFLNALEKGIPFY